MKISVRKIILSLAFVVLLLVVLGSGVIIIKFGVGKNALPQDVCSVCSTSTWKPIYLPGTPACRWPCVSGLLLAIHRTKRQQGDPYSLHWLGLALGLALMSIDELASIHEACMWPLQSALGTSGPLFFAWVIPGFMIVLVVGLLYLRFLLALPPRTRNIFILAALVFISGALGMEMIGSSLYHDLIIAGKEESVPYALETIVEETLEMTGVLIFLYGILDYIKTEIRHWHIEFSD